LRSTTTRVHILNVDASLGRGLSSLEFADARARAVARTVALDAGSWGPTWDRDVWCDCLGLLVLTGALLRRVTVAGRASVELLGAGDVVQPWQSIEHSGLDAAIQWKVCDPTVAAVFDRRFQQTCTPWPEVPSAIVERVLEHSTSLSVRLALAQVPRLSERLLLVMWHLADRWGKVDRHGVVLPFRLSHQTLADLACAQRTSVSHVLRDLLLAGELSRSERGFWRLRGHGPGGAAAPAGSDQDATVASEAGHASLRV
jgi:CRP/FNR family cyclic AMP-dependent transcriptional regulator